MAGATSEWHGAQHYLSSIANTSAMPRLHILGEMKAGSTSLFHLLTRGGDGNSRICGTGLEGHLNKEPPIWFNKPMLRKISAKHYFKFWPQPGELDDRQAQCSEYLDANPVRLKTLDAAQTLLRFTHASSLQAL